MFYSRAPLQASTKIYKLRCIPLLALIVSWAGLGIEAAEIELTPRAAPLQSLGDAISLSEAAIEDLRKPPERFEIFSLEGTALTEVLTSGFSVDNTSRNAVVAGYQRYYMASEGFEAHTTWTGSVATCDAGTVAVEFQDDTLRRINYFRAQAGLLADISFDATKNAKSQEAALMMAANNALSHFPPTSWSCYTSGGAEAAGAGNISLGRYGPASIDGLMTDDGSNNAAVGHRRWLLYPEAQEMGNGSVPQVGTYPLGAGEHAAANCVWVIGDFKANQPAVAVPWPNAGYIPWDLAPNDGESYPRWSYSYPGANFASATVTMTQGATNIPVTLESIANGYGDNTLVWRPSGIPHAAPTSDTTYNITISGITGSLSSVSYAVTLIDPHTVNDLPVITGPAFPATGTDNAYAFSATDQADAYELAIFEESSSGWLEGAEATPAPAIIDQTDAAYALLSGNRSATDSQSFHLATPAFGEGDSFVVDRVIVPSDSSLITFKYQRLFMTPDNQLRVELSLDGGSSFTPIHSIPGGSTGSSSQWDPSFLTAEVDVPLAYEGEGVMLRFRLQPLGSTFIGSGSTNGVYLDDITITNAVELINESTMELAAAEAAFDFMPTVAGTAYRLAMRPILGGAKLAFGPLIKVTAVEPSGPVPVITSASSVIGAQGETFSYAITATESPTAFDASGLPPGASVNPSSGVISGTIAVGSYNGITVSATNANGTGNASLAIEVLSGYAKAVLDLYPGLGGPNEDDDGDGDSNLLEVSLAGRNPTLKDSFTNADTTISHVDPNVIYTIFKSGVKGVDYTPQKSSNLLPESWSELGFTIVIDTDAVLQVSHPMDPDELFLQVDVEQNADTTAAP